MQVTVERYISIGHRDLNAWVDVVQANGDEPAYVKSVKIMGDWRRRNQIARIPQEELDRLVLSVTRREWQEAESEALDKWAAGEFEQRMIFN